MSLLKKQSGFTLVEIILASVILPIILLGIANTYDAVRKSYRLTRQLNEMYIVLSACPEIDRALTFTSLSSNSNCHPNDTFPAEGGSGNILTYTPTLTVTDTTNLPNTDPLSTIPDSKVLDVKVGYLQDNGGTPFELRLLITRDGIAQE